MSQATGRPVMTALTWPDLAAAVDDIFETGELFHTNRPTGMESARRDTNFRTHSEFTTVGKLCRCIMEHDRAVDFCLKLPRCVRVFCND